MKEWREQHKVDVPEGSIGRLAVERFTAGEPTVRMMIGKEPLVPPGTYTRLTAGGQILMSDVPQEIRDHREFIRRARGRVLIHGLGLGMCLQAVARKPEVDHVLVVEVGQAVIDLVWPHYAERFGDRIEIRKGDALTWKPEKGQRWDVVWHDIWPNISLDNLPQMHRLHRRFGRRCDWQGSWSRDRIEARRRAELR